MKTHSLFLRVKEYLLLPGVILITVIKMGRIIGVVIPIIFLTCVLGTAALVLLLVPVMAWFAI